VFGTSRGIRVESAVSVFHVWGPRIREGGHLSWGFDEWDGGCSICREAVKRAEQGGLEVVRPTLCTLAGEIELLIFRIQPHWSSAYDGYGTSSLDTDVGEMGALVDHIRKGDGEYHPVPDQVPQLKTPYRSQNSSHHGSFDWIPRCHPLPHFQSFHPPFSGWRNHASPRFGPRVLLRRGR
jgi:hypothetical protein